LINIKLWTEPDWDSSTQDAVYTDTAKEKADELCNALNEVVEVLRKEVHEMISVPHT